MKPLIPLILSLLLPAWAQAEQTMTAPEGVVGTEGNFSLPDNYRTEWLHLGSWYAHDEGDAHGFHDVYVQPEAVTAYNESGKWPDGTVLIKDVRAPIKGQKTTGNVSWAGGLKVVFMMIKDAKGENQGPNWGEGWGWALFNGDNLTANVSTDYQKDCLGCHVPAKDNDYVFVEGYHLLKQ